MSAENIAIKICKVIESNDEMKGGRIKAIVLPEDKSKDVSEIPYAYPLMPQMIHILPKVGEAVLILLTETGNDSSLRYYIGPIIAQPQNMNNATYFEGATTLFPNSWTVPVVPSSDDGIYAADEDVALYGRKGCDLILKENEAQLRCGARIDDEEARTGESYNKQSPAYVKLSYNPESTKVTNEGTGTNSEYNSVTTIVGDQVLLLGNDGKTYFNTASGSEMITQDEIKNAIEKAHAVPYGDVLIDFLKLFLKMFKEHTHPYPGHSTILSSGNNNFWDFDFSKILSDNVKIN